MPTGGPSTFVRRGPRFGTGLSPSEADSKGRRAGVTGVVIFGCDFGEDHETAIISLEENMLIILLIERMPRSGTNTLR